VFSSLSETAEGAVLLSENGDRLLFVNVALDQLEQNDFLII